MNVAQFDRLVIPGRNQNEFAIILWSQVGAARAAPLFVAAYSMTPPLD